MFNSKFKRIVTCIVVCGFTSFLFASSTRGHGVFKEKLESEIEGLKVTCFACHVKKEPKSVRNEFGDLFHKQFEGKDFTAKWEALEEDKEAREKYEQEEMVPAFLEALKTIGEMENEDGVKYSELIAEGKIEGTKLKK